MWKQVALRHKWTHVMLFEKRYKHLVAVAKKFVSYCNTTKLVLQQLCKASVAWDRVVKHVTRVLGITLATFLFKKILK